MNKEFFRNILSFFAVIVVVSGLLFLFVSPIIVKNSMLDIAGTVILILVIFIWIYYFSKVNYEIVEHKHVWKSMFMNLGPIAILLYVCLFGKQKSKIEASYYKKIKVISSVFFCTAVLGVLLFIISLITGAQAIYISSMYVFFVSFFIWVFTLYLHRLGIRKETISPDLGFFYSGSLNYFFNVLLSGKET